MTRSQTLTPPPDIRHHDPRLFAGLADTITGLTDYRTCLVVLFNDEAPYHRRVLSCSSNVPREYLEQKSTRPYRREDVARFAANRSRQARPCF